MTLLLVHLGSRIAPPRFLAFLAAFALVAGLTVPKLGWAPGILLGFDVGASLFLLLTAPLLKQHDPEDLRRHAAKNDANRAMLLAVTAVTMAAVLTAVAFELQAVERPQMKLAIVGTLILAWLFSNTVYALHYAHLYYRRGSKGGLDFAGDDEPDYGDFLYFAWTLGMTFQTSDTSVTTPQMRRAVTWHCFAAFVFNLGVVAFTINVLA